MAPTPKEYNKMSQKAAPNSKMFRNLCVAFLVGGFICTLGQGIMLWMSNLGLPKEDSGAITSMSLIFLSALLTGLNCYDDIAKHAGAGTLVPITGFANAMVSPALEFKRDDRVIIGTSQKHHEIKVDVLVYRGYRS